MITEFRNEYGWLSNFELVEIVWESIIYPSVEHAFASAKSKEPIWKSICSDPGNSPKYIKKMGRKVDLVSNWESIKTDVMFTLLSHKFNKEPYRSKLIETGNTHIQEGNHWNDTFWGVNLKTGEGENVLGGMIMEIRNDLREG